MKVFSVLCLSLLLLAQAHVIDDHDSATIYSGSFGSKRFSDASAHRGTTVVILPIASASPILGTTTFGSSTCEMTSANHSATLLPLAAPVSKKTRTGAIIGGVIGGTVLLILTGVLLLVFLRRRARQNARANSPLPDETKLSPINPTSESDQATMPLAKPSVVASPPPGVYPFNANTTDSLILGQTRYMPPPVPQAFDNPRVGLPQASISTQPAVARPSITSSLANSATPATTSFMSASVSRSLPSKTQPMKAATSQVHNFENLSSVTSIASPKNSVIGSVTPSIASSALLVPRGTRLADEEPVEFVASPYRQRSPPQDVEGIRDDNNVSSLGQGNVRTTKSNAKFTILLIGETGTGKTSFLALLINVLAGHVPDEYDLEPYDATNEFFSGQSHNAAKVYTFKSVNGVQVTVLDTPGLADTRGLEKDNENKQSITDAIRDSIPEITAVIIVANGTNPHLSVATDYAITTLSSIFSGALADNIGVLFTNISSPRNWNFDVGMLPVELQGAKTFLLDNHLARHKDYLYVKAAAARGSVAGASQAVLQKLKKTVDEGHETTVATLAELFDWLDGLIPQATTSITLLYDQLMEIERNISSTLAHMTQLVEKKGKLDDLLNKSDGMLLTFNEMANVKSVIHKKTWILQDQPYHSTICVHPQCYSNCHIQCHIEFTLDPMKLINCMAFPSGACQFCNHSVHAHQHYNALWSEKHETEEYVDAQRQQRYDKATMMFESTQVSVDDIQNLIDSIGKEMADATGEVGRLVAEYSTLSLSRSFSGQVKKFVKVLETHLEAIRHKMDDASVKRMEASLEQLREKLRVLELWRM